jgi:hypothetical protein
MDSQVENIPMKFHRGRLSSSHSFSQPPINNHHKQLSHFVLAVLKKSHKYSTPSTRNYIRKVFGSERHAVLITGNTAEGLHIQDPWRNVDLENGLKPEV